MKKFLLVILLFCTAHTVLAQSAARYCALMGVLQHLKTEYPGLSSRMQEITADEENREITEAETFNTFVAYPNPAGNEVDVSFNASTREALDIRMIDMAGKTVTHQQLQVAEGVNNFTLDVTDMVKGVYFVEISNANGRSVKKVILEK